MIAGPTAVGKSDVAMSLCKQLGDCELVCADSVQIYKHLNVGTSKPTQQELDALPHHLVGIREPKETFSAGEYVREAFRAIDDIVGSFYRFNTTPPPRSPLFFFFFFACIVMHNL